ncbi:hypothetical protein BZA05DRAFT_389117 [Tricharina praecox]|uniref:uncharacterized protein n=1 Tax=Tricharina praecox TaxID=43433 RepID=UPI00221F1C79|nr:uncharacterized protein BZA05DRAFT_389117 [Tricharina praecox]KAI5856632.1 hypothetical protein BZA05DRAFT_389117 [Tricharina praecox]
MAFRRRLFRHDENYGIFRPTEPQWAAQGHVLSYSYPVYSRDEELEPVHYDDDEDDDDDDDDDDGDEDDKLVKGPQRRQSYLREGTGLQDAANFQPTEFTLDTVFRQLEADMTLFPDEGRPIQILEYAECAPAKKFLSVLEGREEFPDVSQLLAESVAVNTSGIRIRGSFGPVTMKTAETSAFFIWLPFLGGNLFAFDESVRLTEFDGALAGPTLGGRRGEGVHQALFFILNNTTIAKFTSRECTTQNLRLERPGLTTGAFHHVAHMLASVILSDKPLLNEYRAKSNRSFLYLQALSTEFGLGTSENSPDSIDDAKRAALEEISNHLMCLAMAVSVWDKQISLLRDLVNKLRSAISGEQIPVVSQQQEQLKTTIKFLEVTKEARLEVRKELGVVLKQLRTSYENVIQLVASVTQSRPEPTAASASASAAATAQLEAMRLQSLSGSTTGTGSSSDGEQLQELKKIYAGSLRQEGLQKEILGCTEKLVEMAGEGPSEATAVDMKALLESLIEISEDEAREAKRQQARHQYEAKLAREARQAAEDNARKMREDIALQGNTMSLFTVVTIIFLPLAFFTQYFALPYAQGKIDTETKFWIVVAPITIVILIITLLVYLHKKYKTTALKDYVIAICTGKGFKRPKDRAKMLREKEDEERATRAQTDEQKEEEFIKAELARQEAIKQSEARSRNQSTASTLPPRQPVLSQHRKPHSGSAAAAAGTRAAVGSAAEVLSVRANESLVINVCLEHSVLVGANTLAANNGPAP